MAKKDSSKKEKEKPANQSGDIHVDGSVSGNNIIIGHNNTIIIDGKSVAFRTGWFYGHRYGDLESFTGRVDELKLLDDWLANKTENLLIFNAFGGFGKSALTWHWLNNHVDKTIWSTAIWWSFYEKESGFDSFLAEALTHLGIETKERSSRQQVNDLLDIMQNTGLLIVLDGFERLLRQYGRMDAALQEDDEDAEIDPSQRDCTYQSGETFLRGLSDKKIVSKVLMTSRLLPRVLEGKDGKLQPRCREVNLRGFSPDDAVTYFHNEGIKKATRAEIIEVCSKYEYHPLSLSLLVGLINENHEHRGDIAAVKNLEIFEDVKARRHHVLERAYESLALERSDLLSKISCFRGSMEYAVLKKVFPSPNLDKALLDLRKRGLLQYAGETQRYDMHPIVRHYAYDKFAAPDKTDAHTRLVNYFEAVPAPQTVTTLEDLAPVIELYHHMVRVGNLDEAQKLFEDRLQQAIYYQFGAYQLQIELLHALFLDGEDKPPRLKREDDQAWALNELANTYSISGQPRRAIQVFEMIIAYDEKTNNKSANAAITLGNIAYMAELHIGALSAAERDLRLSINLCKEIGDERIEATGHRELGRVLIYLGKWSNSVQELETAEKVFKKIKNVKSLSVTFSYCALLFILMARKKGVFGQRKLNDEPQISYITYQESVIKLFAQLLNTEHLQSAIKIIAQYTLELADITAKVQYSNSRDYIDAYSLLGSAYHANNELILAEENLSKALDRCRQINLVEMEANILLELARLRYAQGDFKDAQEKASEALVITERCGYVLQGADVNLFLAQYALEQEKDKTKAKEYALEAKKLATCDGPPYYYKVAYEEAEAMLEKLK